MLKTQYYNLDSSTHYDSDLNLGLADLPLQTVEPDQLTSSGASDLNLHCLSLLSMWIYINNLYQVIWLAEN